MVSRQYIVNMSVFDALSIGRGLVAAVILCTKRGNINIEAQNILIITFLGVLVALSYVQQPHQLMYFRQY